MEYIKLFWEDAPEGEPPLILYEVDTENERLLIPTLGQIFPVKVPINGDVHEEFDFCFDNWIGKEDWERWMRLVRGSLTGMTAEESAFLLSILGWIETALTHTGVMVVESNL